MWNVHVQIPYRLHVKRDGQSGYGTHPMATEIGNTAAEAHRWLSTSLVTLRAVNRLPGGSLSWQSVKV